MAKITVIGSLIMDNVATMDEFPKAGESVKGYSINYFHGGKGANQCVAISRLGGNCEMIGMVGNDDNGKSFLKLFKEENIKSDNIFTCDKPTGIAQIQIDRNGQNRICFIPSANYEFDYEHVNSIDETIKNSDLIVLQLELRLEITEEIINRANKYGVKILFNPAPALNINKEVLKCVDYITPNESELSALTNMPVNNEEEIINALKKLLSYGCKTIIATLGSEGAAIATNDYIKFVKGYKVKAIDTVGAGDSFNGALAVALVEGKAIEEAVKFGNAMGALTVQKNGAIPSLHTRKEVEEFIKINN